jgi:hypothetical protein
VSGFDWVSGNPSLRIGLVLVIRLRLELVLA